MLYLTNILFDKHLIDVVFNKYKIATKQCNSIYLGRNLVF